MHINAFTSCAHIIVSLRHLSFSVCVRLLWIQFHISTSFFWLQRLSTSSPDSFQTWWWTNTTGETEADWGRNVQKYRHSTTTHYDTFEYLATKREIQPCINSAVCQRRSFYTLLLNVPLCQPTFIQYMWKVSFLHSWVIVRDNLKCHSLWIEFPILLLKLSRLSSLFLPCPFFQWKGKCLSGTDFVEKI